ncbi:uncharacterized protein HD556DRAFT_804955 [Suillus plorans]|uniref:BTB domain-containing protein n=1 Tax=Suillus plorans TaxID=116603 RepID=A0A9P7DSP5_9AGAM|nr:uncharacterized protein HD556DRAFT_804955 [Suillus plorans]KAG1802193.1 hypothetical protein HD556DRAFT_804955 [Suillus plorans]
MAMVGVSSMPSYTVQEATRQSTQAWRNDLTNLFHQAKDRFADVVWELQSDDNDDDHDEVWGHKAIVYARAPPSFQQRYFQFRPPPITSPTPYSTSPSPAPAQSAMSLSLTLDYARTSRSPSPYRSSSPSPSTNLNAVMRIPAISSTTLFSNELEYLYTGEGLGEAFEFLFDTSESRELVDAEENRVDKLRKDLVFMWRSRLYSDVRIALSGTFSSTNHEPAIAIFSSHRFILVSRSPYFHAQLLNWAQPAKPGEPITVTLPSPPFTPASLHFTLGYIYTGTLVFSHRTYDLDTAFAILKSATYLSLDGLVAEIQARIVYEMIHGLFHASLEFNEYERITGSKWGTGGCRCRQCARRAPRVLEFALADDVKNTYLERGARRALVGLFGEGWCISEFASLPQKIRENLLKGLAKRTTPMNVFPLLFAAQHAIKKLDSVIDAWADTSREMVLQARKAIDECLVSQSVECFEQDDWLQVMEADGERFDDGERVTWVMEAIKRGMVEKHAGTMYQSLVNILLRPHPTDEDAAMLSATSHIRVQVEDARADLIRYIRKRWMGTRQQGGFDGLEGWAIKEISQELEVSVEDLISPSQPSHLRRTAFRKSSVAGDADSDTLSVHSLRASVLSRNINNPHKHAREATSSSSAASVRTIGRSSPRNAPTPKPNDIRPDSKLTPESQSIISVRSSTTEKVMQRKTPSPRTGDISPTPNGTKPALSKIITSYTPSPKPKSIAPSVRSRVSAVRSSARESTLRIPSSPRPNSSLSSAISDATFRTAPSEMITPRSRKVSGGSTISNVSARTVGTNRGTPVRERLSSTASTSTTTTSAVATRTSIRRGASEFTKLTPTKRTSAKTTTPSQRKPLSRVTENHSQKSPCITLSDLDKGKDRETIKLDDSTNSPMQDGTSPAADSPPALTRRGSSDTITTSVRTPEQSSASPEEANVLVQLRGATLDVGIPCIVSSKRKRFKAFARYIGEVEGELGPWVGIEVPLEAWVGDPSDGRQWNDGSWGGIRYFDIGNNGSEWEFGADDYQTHRRRKMDWMNGSGRDNRGLKREGDQLTVGIDRTKRMRSSSPAASDLSTSESRGLFVRPQQVLYVVDAVGADL